MPGSPARVLIVEDDALIAMDIAHLLEQCGCTAVGLIGNLEAALDAAQATELDGAVLDIELGSEPVWPLAEFLQRRGIPFVLASGYSYTEVPEHFWHVPLLSKPLTYPVLSHALGEIGLLREA